GERLVGPDDQVPPRDQPLVDPPEDLPLSVPVEIREGQVAAEDQIKRPRGHRLPDVLLAELDPRPELVPDTELLAFPDEGGLEQLARQLLEAARRVAALPGALE